MTPTLSAELTQAERDSRKQQVLAAQVRLLYGNANLSVGVTVVAASILARLQWDFVSHQAIIGWWLYMVLLSAGRFVLARRFWQSAESALGTGQWLRAFATGAALAGAGWGTAGILLYPEARLANQVFLVYILGGMILGASATLAARPEAYLPFILSAGLAPSARLAWHGDQVHVAMGLLGALFTLATIITTRRIHHTIISSLNLQFENADLVEDLRAVTRSAEALNERLENRVEERTAELHRSNEQLRDEVRRREEIEEELLRAQKLESLGVLAGGIAHDFNNFLAVVQGNVELAKAQLAPAAPVQAILDETTSACQRAAFLSSQLLTFSKGGAPVRRLISIAKLVADTFPLVRAGAQTSIEVSVADDLRWAEVDPSQIGQVLHNILLNARQAMPEGGKIEIRAENADRRTPSGIEPRVKISIRDHGPGISSDVLPRIFDPYFTTKPGGTGLGLATAYGIVNKHGGVLSVETKTGEGSVFSVELPASIKTQAPQPPGETRVRAGSGRILVMDDEEALRNLVRAVLTNLGYEVETAADGAEAIALLESAMLSGRSFAAALLDLTVSGGMGGLEASGKLRALDASLKLIVSSGYSDAPVLSQFQEYGFDAAIPKPWTVAQMSEVVSSVLKGPA